MSDREVDVTAFTRRLEGCFYVLFLFLSVCSCVINFYVMHFAAEVTFKQHFHLLA